MRCQLEANITVIKLVRFGLIDMAYGSERGGWPLAFLVARGGLLGSFVLVRWVLGF